MLDTSVAYRVARLGWPAEYIAESLYKNLKNHCSATYYLLAHDFMPIL